MNPRFLFCVGIAGSLGAAMIATENPPSAPEVPFPDGYRMWQHVSSAVLKPTNDPAATTPKADDLAAPHGLMSNIYANEKAVEGYRTGDFPEGAVLVVDWFVLEERGPMLGQGPRKSVNVMVRDARYAETGGWGFEDFNRDSRTERNVGPKAVPMCFECHTKAKDRECVFSVLKP